MSLHYYSRTGVALLLILVVLIIISGVLLRLSIPEPTTIIISPPQPTATPPPTFTPAPILVYVTGAVAQPNRLVQLAHVSRVADALAAVGGLVDGANETLVNQAAILRDGDQVHVPFLGEDSASAALPTPQGGRRINLNLATQAELETLPGIGPATARRILEYRELVGAFGGLEDLDNVSGIGEATLKRLKDLVAFD